jgi:pimeloyl-ACP methyl ester carboxylesterase
MPRANANGLELEYDELGDPNAPPLILIAGLGAQMIDWAEDFCELLAAGGPFHVIRYDNRDSGLSTRLDERPAPDVFKLLSGEEEPAYTLQDMAEDAAGLITALGLGNAHIVGASTGGFIAQRLAIDHPERALSLTSIMSTPAGIVGEVPPAPAAVEAMLQPPPTDRDSLIEHGVWVSSVIQSPTYFDAGEERARWTRAVDRSVSPAGTARQLGAMAAAPSRLEALGRLGIPVLVIHGEKDPLMPVENGRRTAAAIPGARLLVFPDMGHELPRPLWSEIVRAIAENAKRPAPTIAGSDG